MLRKHRHAIPRPSDVVDVLFVETADISVESHLKGQLAYLAERGIRPYVIARDTGLLDEILEADGVKGHSRAFERNPAPFHDLKGLAWLLRDLRRLRPRAIAYGTPKASLLASIAGAAMRVRRRTYFIYGIRAETATGWLRRVLLYAERIVIAASTDVLAVGSSLRERMSELGLPVRKVRVLGAGSANGVDVRHFREEFEASGARARARTLFGLPDRSIVIGFVGRLTPDKGLDTLFAAAESVRAEHPDLQLLLVGPRENITDLQSRTRGLLSQGWVHETGSLPDTAIAYPAMDVFCLPSRREGLPTVLLEAAAAGVPIVATDATGIRDIVTAETGVVVPVDDADALADALDDMIRDHAQARAFARCAQERVAAEFDSPVVWERLAKYYA